MLWSAFRRSGDRFVERMRVTTRIERRRPDAMGSDTALGAAPIRPATPASRGGTQAPAKGAPGIARDRSDPSRLRFAAHLRLRPRLETEAWTRARRPDRSNSFFRKNTFPPAALRSGPGGRLADRPAGYASDTNPEGDAGRRETSGWVCETLPVSRRPAEGPLPYHGKPSFRFGVTVSPPASTPDLGAVGPSARLPARGEGTSADGYGRTRPHRTSYWGLPPRASRDSKRDIPCHRSSIHDLLRRTSVLSFFPNSVADIRKSEAGDV